MLENPATSARMFTLKDALAELEGIK